MLLIAPLKRSPQLNYLSFAFLLLMLAFAASCAKPPEPQQRTLYEAPAPAVEHNITPVRGETKALVFTMDDMVMKCTDCHEAFTGELQQEALEGAHAGIAFDHGMNLRCLNCHNANVPDTYVAHDGSAIPAAEPTQLCAKCHGPHYRDWRIGIHGRANGHWAERLGERTRLNCIQCHNPHQPRFQPMKPDPPTPLTRFTRSETPRIDLSLREDHKETASEEVTDAETQTKVEGDGTE